MPGRFDRTICEKLLRDKREALLSAGRQRYPSRSDFTADEVAAIKAFLGPWPRALERSGIKPARTPKGKDRQNP